MKMKRRSIALLLALMMCLSLLSACGANKTEEAVAPESAVDTAGQQEVVKEEPKQEPEQEAPEETEEPEEEESEEEEPEEAAEPQQEEVEEQNNAGTEFLALLQEEYENGFFVGEGLRHTYYYNLYYTPFIYNGVVYIFTNYGRNRLTKNNENNCITYDINSKEMNEFYVDIVDNYMYFIDGNFYCVGYNGNVGYEAYMYDCNGVFLNSFSDNNNNNVLALSPFDKGFLHFDWQTGTDTKVLSYNLEIIAEIALPQREIEHGLIEDMNLRRCFFADGTEYAEFNGDDSLYRLNTDTYEWENTGNAPASISGYTFLGKYISGNDGIYDYFTGELVFEYGELYHSVCEDSSNNLCYFGGDKYLGYNGREYRWVSLTDLSMSDPLPFPDEKEVTILNDTYLIYQDKYGVFLWNYNDGTEETIVMYDN